MAIGYDEPTAYMLVGTPPPWQKDWYTDEDFAKTGTYYGADWAKMTDSMQHAANRLSWSGVDIWGRPMGDKYQGPSDQAVPTVKLPIGQGDYRAYYGNSLNGVPFEVARKAEELASFGYRFDPSKVTKYDNTGTPVLSQADLIPLGALQTTSADQIRSQQAAYVPPAKRATGPATEELLNSFYGANWRTAKDPGTVALIDQYGKMGMTVNATPFPDEYVKRTSAVSESTNPEAAREALVNAGYLSKDAARIYAKEGDAGMKRLASLLRSKNQAASRATSPLDSIRAATARGEPIERFAPTGVPTAGMAGLSGLSMGNLGTAMPLSGAGLNNFGAALPSSGSSGLGVSSGTIGSLAGTALGAAAGLPGMVGGLVGTTVGSLVDSYRLNAKAQDLGLQNVVNPLEGVFADSIIGKATNAISGLFGGEPVAQTPQSQAFPITVDTPSPSMTPAQVMQLSSIGGGSSVPMADLGASRDPFASMGATLSIPGPAPAPAPSTPAPPPSFGGFGCFITTAMSEQLGKPDDCEELETLRWFRDNVMILSEEGDRAVAEYYRIAPKIVEGIGDNPKKYEELREKYIAPAVDAVQNGSYSDAWAIYQEMVLSLKQEYLGD